MVWNDWLEWLCLSLDFSKVREYDGYPNMLLHAKNDNELFFEAMSNWFNYAADKARENGGAFDSFGHLYEENFQSGYKASKSSRQILYACQWPIVLAFLTHQQMRCLLPRIPHAAAAELLFSITLKLVHHIG